MVVTIRQRQVTRISNTGNLSLNMEVYPLEADYKYDCGLMLSFNEKVKRENPISFSLPILLSTESACAGRLLHLPSPLE